MEKGHDTLEKLAEMIKLMDEENVEPKNRIIYYSWNVYYTNKTRQFFNRIILFFTNRIHFMYWKYYKANKVLKIILKNIKDFKVTYSKKNTYIN